MTSVTLQPSSLGTMNVYHDFPTDEKHQHSEQCQHGDTECAHGHAHAHSSSHRRCHASRLRRLLFPIIISLISVGAVLAFSCMYDMLGLFGSSTGEGGYDGLMKRQSAGNGSGSNGNNGDVFVDRKRECF
ncbi:hypothetical protein D9758_004348 [Tetrapyrgos nigripes]|uniref:Uncharacterized protein n=1 Tax=Tetrapyrgos nigripes TaxID=182062 RepID=A0A8H5LSK6_9AGAR|nr:hypothetical protein D9758_004348 [Tetrapyrgos nigripes]